MQKLSIFGSLLSLCFLLLCQTVSSLDNYPNLKGSEENSDDPLYDTCRKLDQKTALFLTTAEKKAKEQCAFLNNIMKQTKENGCSSESLGLGFKTAIKHFHQQNEEDKIFAREIRDKYLACDRSKGKQIIKQAITDILPAENQETKEKEYRKLKKRANENVQMYVKNFREIKKTQQKESIKF